MELRHGVIGSKCGARLVGRLVRDELKDIAARREGLKAILATIDEPPPLLHPEMPRICRAKVTELASAFQEPETRSETTEGPAAS